MPAPTQLGKLTFNYDNTRGAVDQTLKSPDSKDVVDHSGYHSNQHDGEAVEQPSSHNIANLKRSNSNRVILDDNNLKSLFEKARKHSSVGSENTNNYKTGNVNHNITYDDNIKYNEYYTRTTDNNVNEITNNNIYEEDTKKSSNQNSDNNSNCSPNKNMEKHENKEIYGNLEDQFSNFIMISNEYNYHEHDNEYFREGKQSRHGSFLEHNADRNKYFKEQNQGGYSSINQEINQVGVYEAERGRIQSEQNTDGRIRTYSQDSVHSRHSLNVDDNWQENASRIQSHYDKFSPKVEESNLNDRNRKIIRYRQTSDNSQNRKDNDKQQQPKSFRFQSSKDQVYSENRNYVKENTGNKFDSSNSAEQKLYSANQSEASKMADVGKIVYPDIGNQHTNIMIEERRNEMQTNSEKQKAHSKYLDELYKKYLHIKKGNNNAASNSQESPSNAKISPYYVTSNFEENRHRDTRKESASFLGIEKHREENMINSPLVDRKPSFKASETRSIWEERTTVPITHVQKEEDTKCIVIDNNSNYNFLSYDERPFQSRYSFLNTSQSFSNSKQRKDKEQSFNYSQSFTTPSKDNLRTDFRSSYSIGDNFLSHNSKRNSSEVNEIQNNLKRPPKMSIIKQKTEEFKNREPSKAHGISHPHGNPSRPFQNISSEERSRIQSSMNKKSIHKHGTVNNTDGYLYQDKEDDDIISKRSVYFNEQLNSCYEYRHPVSDIHTGMDTRTDSSNVDMNYSTMDDGELLRKKIMNLSLLGEKESRTGKEREEGNIHPRKTNYKKQNTCRFGVESVARDKYTQPFSRPSKKTMEFHSNYMKQRHLDQSQTHADDEGYETGRTSVSSEMTSNGSDLFVLNHIESRFHFTNSKNESTAPKQATMPHKQASLSNLHEILNLEAEVERVKNEEDLRRDNQKKSDEDELDRNRKDIHNKLESMLKVRVKSMKEKNDKKTTKFPDPLLVNESPLIIEQKQNNEVLLDQQSQHSCAVTNQTNDSFINQYSKESSQTQIKENRSEHVYNSKDNDMGHQENVQSQQDMLYQQQQEVFLNTINAKRTVKSSNIIIQPYDYGAQPKANRQGDISQLNNNYHEPYQSNPETPAVSLPIETLNVQPSSVDASYSGMASSASSRRNSISQIGLGKDSEDINKKENMLNELRNTMVKRGLSRPASPDIQNLFQPNDNLPEELYATVNKPSRVSVTDAQPTNEEHTHSLNILATNAHQAQSHHHENQITMEQYRNDEMEIDSIPYNKNVNNIGEDRSTCEEPINKTAVMTMLKAHIKIKTAVTKQNEKIGSVKKRSLKQTFSFNSTDIEREYPDVKPMQRERRLSTESVKPELDILSSASFRKNHSISSPGCQKMDEFYKAVEEFNVVQPQPGPPGNTKDIRQPEVSVRERAGTFMESTSEMVTPLSQNSDVDDTNNIMSRSRSRANSYVSENDINDWMDSLPNASESISDRNSGNDDGRSPLERRDSVPMEEIHVVRQYQPQQQQKQKFVPSLDLDDSIVPDSSYNTPQSPLIFKSNRGKNMSQTEYYLPEENGESVIKPSEFQVHRYGDRTKRSSDVAKPEKVEYAKLRVEHAPSLTSMSLNDLKKERNSQRMKQTPKNLQNMDKDVTKDHKGFDATKLMGDTLSKKSAKKKIEKWSNEPYTTINVGKISIPDHFQEQKQTAEFEVNEDLSNDRKHKRDFLKQNSNRSSNASSPRPSTAKKTRRFSLTSLGSPRTDISTVTMSTTAPASPALSQKSFGSRFKQLFSPKSKRKQQQKETESLDEDIVRRLNMNSTVNRQNGDISNTSYAGSLSARSVLSLGSYGTNNDDDDDDDFGLDDNFLSNEEWLGMQKNAKRNMNPKHQPKPVIKQSLGPVSGKTPDHNSWKTRKSFIGKVTVPDVFSDHNANIKPIRFNNSRKYKDTPVGGNTGRILYTGEILTDTDAVINSFDVDQ